MLAPNHSAREGFKASTLCSAGCWAGQRTELILWPQEAIRVLSVAGAWADSRNFSMLLPCGCSGIGNCLSLRSLFIPREKRLKPGPLRPLLLTLTSEIYAQVAEFHLLTNATQTGLCTY